MFVELRFYSKDEDKDDYMPMYELQYRTRDLVKEWNGALSMSEWSEWKSIPLVTANDDPSEP